MQVYQVKGMGCGSCVGKITRALAALDDTATVTVDLAAGLVSVVSTVPPSEIQASIAALGFEVVQA
ncbi:heavy metal-associated domain-containing protein [Chitinimonas sp.]|uniref:heavy-metal-associated domain-containing protein n=1 Tax=Chitinimonas sp. TaxID=1934313 RepID=UPI002F94A7C7